MKKGRRTLLAIIGVFIILLCGAQTIYGTANNPETKKGKFISTYGEQRQHVKEVYYNNGWDCYDRYGNYQHYYGIIEDPYDGVDEIIKVFSNKREEVYSYKNKTVDLEKPQEYLREEFLPLAFLALENKEISQYEEDGCSFCDGDELTLREKCEELIVKALTDEKNLLDDGFITEEVYHLQCEPFEKWLDRLETLPEEELPKEYIAILEYHLDKVAEEWADGEEVDEYFFEYIVQELEKYYGLEQKKSEAGKIEFARFSLFYCYRFSKVSRFIDI